MFHKHSIADSKVQMGMIPIVVLRIPGGGGVYPLLCQPINLVQTVETVGGKVLPWELILCPTYLEVRQIGVAKIRKEKGGGARRAAACCVI